MHMLSRRNNQHGHDGRKFSVLGRRVSFKFCLKLINNMQGGSDFFSNILHVIFINFVTFLFYNKIK